MLKFALRSLLRQPGYLLLNLLGFGLGVACAFVAVLYAWQEFNYDRHFPNGDRVYRVGSSFMNMGGFANGPEALASQLLNDCPSVEYATHFKKYASEKIVVDNQTFEEEDVLYVDSSFFRMFKYPFLEGNPALAMTTPDQVLLSKKLAVKYFGNRPAIGQTLKAGDEGRIYLVAGVIGDNAHRSHLDGNIWLPVYSKLRNKLNPDWYSASYYTYVRLQPGASEAELSTGLDRIVREQIYPDYAADTPFDSWIKSENGFKWLVQPLQDIYLHSRLNFEAGGGGDPDKVYGFLLIGFFILLIAMVNYINLVTARASLRAKEVGIRKALGVRQGGLVRQFLNESMLFSLGAALVGLVASEGLLALFKGITGSALLDLSRYRMEQVFGIVVFTMLAGVLTGIYPALFLARFRPTAVLKGEWSVQGNRTLRSVLVVGQFAIAVVLMIGSLGVFRQLRFMEQRDWGFQRQGICVIEKAKMLGDKEEAFRQELARQSGVSATCITESLPAGANSYFKTYQTPAMTMEMPLKSYLVDADFVPTLGMKLVAGRNFDKSMPTDTANVLVNESAVKALGLGPDPLGAEVNRGAKVIGVLSDFNFESLRKEVAPLVLQYSPKGYYVVAKINAAATAGFIKTAQASWEKMVPDAPFSYYFLDESLAELSEKEAVLGKAILFFTILALFIACLGLFGLVAFTAGQRSKEIGVRKVLGATVLHITGLLTKDFLLLVMIAVVLAAPVAWWAVHSWLQGFVYRTSLPWWIFVLAGLAAAMVALLTVSFQSVRAAMENPVKSLRSE